MENAFRKVSWWFALPIVAMLSIVVVSSPAQAQGGLRDAAGNMHVGAAVTPNLLNNSTYANIARTHFSSVTAENQMKMDTVQPSQGNFNFGPGDQIVQFAQQNNQHVYGHTMVWHSQAPGWIQGLNASQMDAAMQNHISTVLQHWPNMGYWDVANEVMDDNAQLRQSFWLNTLGPDYIADAFRYARAADGNTGLCLNDYSIDGINAKSDAYFNLVQQLLQQGVPITCMGFQAHLILGQVPSSMQQNLQRFANLGLDVWITELDIRIPKPVNQQQHFQQQANEFAEVFQICKNVSRCQGVTVWGIHDAQSWVDSTFPEFDSPLMWDDNLNPKPAVNAVLQALGGSTTPPTTTPPTTTPPTTTPPTTPPTTTSPPGGGGGPCQVSYQANDWGGSPGFTANVTVTNTGSSTINGWQVGFNFSAGQTVDVPGWNATVSQSGGAVTAVDMGYNATLAPGQSTTFGFNGMSTSIGNNPPPTSFTLNGTACSVR